VRLMLLTGGRRNEVARATWAEFSEDTWTVPAERMKNRTAHVVPLTPAMKELLGECPRCGPFVFSYDGWRPVNSWDHAKKKIDALMPPGTAAWRIHDCRRSVRSGLAALGVSDTVAELVISHTQKNLIKTYNLYRYESEKRAALELWAERVRVIVHPIL
jgi:integrase